jgi:hypothetical protein
LENITLGIQTLKKKSNIVLRLWLELEPGTEWKVLPSLLIIILE